MAGGDGNGDGGEDVRVVEDHVYFIFISFVAQSSVPLHYVEGEKLQQFTQYLKFKKTRGKEKKENTAQQLQSTVWLFIQIGVTSLLSN